MTFRLTKLIVVGVTALATLSVAANTCEAGPILDWLFPNRAARRAQAQAGTVTFRVPVGTYPPSQNLSNYTPRTSYRTVWAPIPVTQYRPVSYVNPLSTSGAAAMRPCTSYEWQARRVPYVSYQPTAQINPSAVSAPAAVPWTSPSPSCCGNTSYYGATGSGVAPIATEWTPVGSGVSTAAPAATATPSYSAVPGSVVTGYPNGQTFSPSSTVMQQYQQTPQTNATAPVCQSCPAGAPTTVPGTSPAGTFPGGATPWVPLDQDRTRITPLPADTRPSLYDPPPDRPNGNVDLNRQPGTELQPATPPTQNGSGTRETGIDSSPHFGTNNPAYPPTVSRDDPYRRQLSEESLKRNNSLGGSSTVGQDPYRSSPSRTQSVPYLKPIPDLKRSQRSQWDAAPIPNLLDDPAEHTAQRTPRQRDAVPINWSQVDIDRQGSIKRVPVNIRPIAEQAGHPSTGINDQSIWQRVRPTN